MTRSARTRRGNRKAPLAATPWNSLKGKGYAAIHEEESDLSSLSPSTAKVKKVKKGQLKETKKQKLAEVKLSKKLKQSLTVKKLKVKLNDTETLSLLSPSGGGGNSSGDKTVRKKKRKETLSFGGDSVQCHDTDNKVSAVESSSGSPCGGSSSAGNDSSLAACRSEAAECDDAVSSSTGRGSRLNQPLIPIPRVDERRHRRIEARKLRRRKQKVCFNCRKSGHLVQDCPEQLESDLNSCVAGMCFKCGSAEHTSRTCKVNSSEGDFPYAKCFICGEVGHLSRSCPDNPKGLYPKGGCCKVCGSVQHLKSNCPEKTGKTASSGFSGLVLTNPHSSADAEDDWAGSSTGERQRNTARKLSGSKGNSRTKRTTDHAKYKVVQF